MTNFNRALVYESCDYHYWHLKKTNLVLRLKKFASNELNEVVQVDSAGQGASDIAGASKMHGALAARYVQCTN